MCCGRSCVRCCAALCLEAIDAPHSLTRRRWCVVTEKATNQSWWCESQMCVKERRVGNKLNDRAGEAKQAAAVAAHATAPGIAAWLFAERTDANGRHRCASVGPAERAEALLLCVLKQVHGAEHAAEALLFHLLLVQRAGRCHHQRKSIGVLLCCMRDESLLMV